MTIPINVAGTWKDGAPWINVAGVWTQADEGYIHDGTAFKIAFQNVQTFTSTGVRTSVNIWQDFGSPSVAGNFEWTNTGSIESGSAGTYAVTTGAFPAGSTLKIINQSYMRGRGGKGGDIPNYNSGVVGSPGKNALKLGFDVTIDNGSGYIWGGGGGGGTAGLSVKGNGARAAGGGGAGDDAGGGGVGSHNGSAGTQTTGGSGGSVSGKIGGTGGACGVAGAAGTGGTFQTAGGAAGKAISKNGFSATFTSGNDSTRVKGAVS